MTDVRKFFEKKYLGAWDIPEGKDVILVIERVDGQKVKGGKGDERKAPVLFFSNVQDKSKGMVLNVGNAKTIAALYGVHVEQWKGKRIAIYASKTDAFGEKDVDCIRVRPTEPAPSKSSDE